MIIQCENCSKKFIAKDSDIPQEGRMVQCGYCSVTWHQMPVSIPTKILKKTDVNEPTEETDESLSVDSIQASDGKKYKFLGSQWAQLLPSGKTGLFAKRKIGKELDKLTGRKSGRTVQKRQKKIKEVIDPSSENLDDKKQSSNIDKPKQGLGFLGYIFLLIIIGFSIVGILRTFEDDLLNYFPETEYIYELLDEQLEFLSETIKNMIVIVNDLISGY
tara:strand:+ start:286 stop:936 length:651 start_codon:yes stop_codon:yes gene_type:complete